MAKPGAEAPALALEVRCHIGGDHRRFDQEGAYTAHRVGQGATLGGDAWPAGTDQHRRGQVFLERRSTLLQAIAALVQAVAGEVERKNRLAPVQTQVNTHVRVDFFYRWAQTFTIAQFVDDGILDLQRAEVGVVDARAMAAELDRQGTVGRQVIGPVDSVHAIVKVVGIFHVEALEHQQHAVGQTRPEAQAVGGFHVGRAADGRGVLAHIVKAQALGLFGKQAFQAFGAGEIKFETVRHVYSRALGYLSDEATHRPADVCPNALPASVRVALICAVCSS
ncbi:hypothetical protein D3C78_984970 [compost metagenome]